MLDIYNVLDAISEIVYVSDAETHEILYINEAGKKILGDCLGETCYKLFHGKSAECANCPCLNGEGLSEYIHENVMTEKAYIIKHKDTVWDGKKAYLDIAFNITNTEEIQKRLEQRLDMEHILVSCMVEMHKNKPFEEGFTNLLGIIGKYFEADKVFVFSYDENKLSNVFEWNNNGVNPRAEELKSLDSNVVDKWLPTYDSNENVILNNVEDLKEISVEAYHQAVKSGVQRLVASPIADNGKIIGFIGASNLPEEKFSQIVTFFDALDYFVASMIIREKSSRKLRELSYVDSLTGLYNRNKFTEDTERIMRGRNCGLGVLYMDLNGLKEINDKSGHCGGDCALKDIASVIIESFGKECSYRVGGDEFVVLRYDTNDKEFTAKVTAFRNLISEMKYKVSIGFHYSKDSSDIDEVIKIADEKMYQDKKYYYRNNGQSARYRFYNDTFVSFSTQEKLKKLIQEERFVIWFQPRFSAINGEFCGSEALIRYFDEDDTIVSPMDFIPAMEYNETVHMIDLYVFRHVCEYISGWIEAGKNIKPVSVNISHCTIVRPNFMENLMDIWFDYNIPKDSIVIEVSEDKVKGGLSDVLDKIVELKNNGFHIAIDNYGAKYADLFLFSEVKFDTLKLDRELVHKLETDEKTCMISKSVIDICKNYNISVVAEGVENEKEYDILKEMGCDEAQGYLFDKPMSWNRFEEKYL